MADNVAITAGTGTSIAADEVTDGTLGTVKAQFIKVMDGTLDSTNKWKVNANGSAYVILTDASGNEISPSAQNEDDPASSGEAGIPALAVYTSTKSQDAGTTGDYSWLKTNSVGDLNVDGGQSWFVDFTFSSISTSATVVAGDILADTELVAQVTRANNAGAVLHSVTVIDSTDNGEAIDLVFMNTSTSLGTEDSAISISAANLAAGYLGTVSIDVADYKDFINAKAATKTSIGMMIKPVSGSDDIYIGIVKRGGTGTYTAAGITLRLGFLAD